jgi:hypothetical protein
MPVEVLDKTTLIFNYHNTTQVELLLIRHKLARKTLLSSGASNMLRIGVYLA